MSRPYNLRRLGQIVEIRSLQKAGREAALGAAISHEDRRLQEEATARESLEQDQSMWLATLDGPALRLDAGAIWAGAVRAGADALDRAGIEREAAGSQRADAQSAMRSAVASHEAAGAVFTAASRRANRKREEVALEAAEDRLGCRANRP